MHYVRLMLIAAAITTVVAGLSLTGLVLATPCVTQGVCGH